MTGGGTGTGDDLFDRGAGVRVIAASAQQKAYSGRSDPRSIFGYWNPDSLEPENAIFADGKPAGTVDFVDFETAGPVDLRSIALRLHQEGASPYRGASAFRLLASVDGMEFFPISGGAVPSGPNGNLYVPLLITDSALRGSPTNVRAFRLELTRASSGGVRVVELDGGGTVTQQPGVFLDRLAFNAMDNRLTGRGDELPGDEAPGLATGFKVSSRLAGRDDPEGAFGRGYGPYELDTFIFADGGVADNGNLVLGDAGETVDFIEWKTTMPIALAGYRLTVAGDASSMDRGTALVRFLVDGAEADRFHNAGATGAVVRRFEQGVIEGDTFRIELTRSSTMGPRIMEIDALTGPTPEIPGAVRVNEVLSQNRDTIEDEDGDSPDCIELFNGSEVVVNLQGWGLSDRPSMPYKWVLPGTNLPPRGFLTVFASGKDRAVAGGALHANFQLGVDGETVVLTQPDGVVADTVPPVRLRADVSYGRQPDGVGAWRYLAQPTPGEANNGLGGTSLVFAAPSVSPAAGFYLNPMLVTAQTAEAGVTLRYTLDGSEPTEESPAMSGPIRIASRAGASNVLSMINGTSIVNQHTDGWKPPIGEVRKATVLRVRASRPGGIPGPVTTHTYFVGSDAVRADALPVIAITSPTNGLFDYTTGIYMLGAVFDQYMAAHPGVVLTGHTPANYTQRGGDWERAAHIEYFEPGSGLAFEQPAVIDIQGQSTRSFRQKSLGLKARGEGTREFDYAFFPGLTRLGDGTPLRAFRHLRLRNCGNDWDYAFMRDDWCHRMAAGLGLDVMSSRPASLFLDGEYWGILTVREQQDPEYMEAHYGVPEAEVVILMGEGALEEGRPGDEQPFRNLRTFAQTHDLAEPGAYEYVRQRMDVENFTHYQLAEIYFANADWPHNNTRVWRRRLPTSNLSLPRGQDGRWRWVVFDLDLGVAHPWSTGMSENTLSYALSPTGRPGIEAPWATAFLRALVGNPEFRTNFITTAADLLNSQFNGRRASGMVDAMEAELLPGMAEHIRRWQGNGGTVTQWRERVRLVKSFAQQRAAIVRSHFTGAFGLPGTAQVTVNVNNEAWGAVKVNRLLVNRELAGANSAAPYPWVGYYFKSLPLSVEARPAPGYQFLRWSGAGPFATSPAFSLIVSSNLNLVAEFGAAGPRITGFARVELNTVRLEFTGQSNEAYALETSSDLSRWVELGPAVAGVDGKGSVSFPIGLAEQKRFYRLRRP